MALVSYSDGRNASVELRRGSSQYGALIRDGDRELALANVSGRIPFYAMLLLPHEGQTPMPLVVAQHGGGGTPELCSDMYGKTKRSDWRGAVDIRQSSVKRGLSLFIDIRLY